MFGLKFPAGNLVEGEGQSLLWGCCARGPWVFHSGTTGMMHHLYRVAIRSFNNLKIHFFLDANLHLPSRCCVSNRITA